MKGTENTSLRFRLENIIKMQCLLEASREKNEKLRKLLEKRRKIVIVVQW
jgi:cell shape-determining protein MreC